MVAAVVIESEAAQHVKLQYSSTGNYFFIL